MPLRGRLGAGVGLPSNLVARRWEAPRTRVENPSNVLVLYKQIGQDATSLFDSLTLLKFYVIIRYWVRRAIFGVLWFH